MVKRLYVNLSIPLKFGIWDELSLKKPMGWMRAAWCIDKNYKYNKLKILNNEEINTIKNKLVKFKLRRFSL